MENRVSATEFINNNYTPVHDVSGDGYKPRITIFKAKKMGDLPKQLIDYMVMDGEQTFLYSGKRTGWGCCDWGTFNASYTKKYYYRKGYVSHIKMYVNAIIRTPFTQEQRDKYEMMVSVTMKRIYHIYDSACNDDVTTADKQSIDNSQMPHV